MNEITLKGHKHVLEDYIKINLEEIVWECVDWIHLAQDREK